MNINGLLNEIGLKIKILYHSQDGASRNELLEKNLNNIKASFILLSEEAKRIDAGHNFMQKQKIKGDLKSLLKIVNSKSDNDEMVAMRTAANIKKLMVKYNIKDVATQDKSNNAKNPVKQNEHKTTSESSKQRTAEEIAYQEDLQNRLSYKIKQIKDRERADSEYQEGLKARIAAAKQATIEKKNKKGIEYDGSIQLLDIAEIKKHEIAMEEAEINQKTAAKVKELLEEKARLKREAKERSGQNQEEEKYESQVNEKAEEQMKSKPVEIRYELQNDCYYMNNQVVLSKPQKISKKSDKVKFIKSVLGGEEKYSKWVSDFKHAEKKAIKKCDPYVFAILAKQDTELARTYIKELAGTSKPRAEKSLYTITYDVRGLEGKTSQLSLDEKRNIRKIAKDSKRNSNVIEDERKLPWYAAIPVVGAIAIAAVSGGTALFNHNSENGKEQPSDSIGYTDSNEPGTTTDKSATETQSSDYIAYTTTATELSSSTSTTQTERATTSTTTNKNSTETKTTTTNKNSTEPQTTTTNKNSTELQTTAANNVKEPTSTTTTRNNEDENKENATDPVIFDIGDKVSVSEGLQYSATCLGEGKQNKIGNVSWRPATEYYVDRVAFCHDKQILGIMNKGDKDVRQVLENYASQYKIDVSEIDISALLSLTPGNGDTGWASISIEELEQNISKDDDNKKDTEEHTNTKKTIKSDRDR